MDQKAQVDLFKGIPTLTLLPPLSLEMAFVLGLYSDYWLTGTKAGKEGRGAQHMCIYK